MTRVERAQALRERTDRHFNCCQSVLAAFADVCGMDEAGVCRLGTSFGGGMRHGATCGAVTGGLMVLGLAGKDLETGEEFMRRFREKNGPLDCAAQLRAAKERGEERKPHCDRMVCSAAAMVEDLLAGR